MTTQTEGSSLSWIAAVGDQGKVRLPGTDRAGDPAATLEMATRAARHAGVTRVADITWLDTIGIPTYQAIRPASQTLAVSQGKGITPELAKLSALMEAVELWHAEQPMPADVTAAPREVAAELSYDVRALTPATPSVLHDGLPLEWVMARSLADGSGTLVPKDTVGLSLARRTGWNPPVFFASSNGLASGNTLIESVLHALYEVIERDAMTAALGTGEMGERADPRTLGSAVVAELCDLIERAGVRLEVRSVPSPTGLPCFLARITCDDYPPAFTGFGCHLSSEIALTRAVTEAAQTRLGYIAGSRDDLWADFNGDPAPGPRPPSEPGAAIVPLAAHQSLLDDLEDVVGRASRAFSHAPLVVDLTHEAVGVPVVRVLAPGSRVRPEVL
ncbi:YcaO-like family protein [Spongiactinospora sp. TRM90649]|uniref:YcaO-like family protein n=1 Tax=Spongiactinospora sp. TRM90649 TaxID=3031114 RepID=UPI0023F92378|nr:YcaO-like family protein [Spongiactinospora sp. TRM90649]MDF5759110.1 YcaO-like family protein [Spongiactinospora sp. TRM90649]